MPKLKIWCSHRFAETVVKVGGWLNVKLDKPILKTVSALKKSYVTIKCFCHMQTLISKYINNIFFLILFETLSIANFMSISIQTVWAPNYIFII